MWHFAFMKSQFVHLQRNYLLMQDMIGNLRSTGQRCLSKSLLTRPLKLDQLQLQTLLFPELFLTPDSFI